MAEAHSTHVALTPAYLRRLRPNPAGDLIRRDDDLTGFAVRVKPTGSMSLFVEARVAGTGKQRRKTITNLDPATIADEAVREARSEAMRVLAEWRGGNDTVKAEREAGGLPTLQQVLDRYLEVRRLKASTAADYQQLLDTHLAKWKDHGIDTITPGAVKDLHRRIPSQSRADAAMRVLRALWNFAWSDNLDDVTGQPRLQGKNPVDVLSGLRQWNGSEPKKSHIPKGKFKVWHQAVMAMKPERSTSRVDVVRDLFLFCVYTGVRLSEALNLQDADVDLKARTFTLRDTKNRSDFTLPASTPVLEILKRRKGNGRLFPVEKSSLVRYRKQLTDACGVVFTVHDLRRTYATHARDIGIEKRVVGELLNHKTGRDVTAGYISQSPEPYRDPMAKIAAHFGRLAK
jgi:integrase